MKQLYAPWRNNYVNKVLKGKMEHTPQEECVFCVKIAAHDDAKHFILRRFEHNLVLLNLYPYNAGHLLIIPAAHKKNLQELTKEARLELMELVYHSTNITQTILGAEGVNIGMNLGKAAGAGIPAHLHMHVLPRWTGDTNFLPLLAETKQISIDLHKLYQELKPHFQAITL